jgi:hypothetical protein
MVFTRTVVSDVHHNPNPDDMNALVDLIWMVSGDTSCFLSDFRDRVA